MTQRTFTPASAKPMKQQPKAQSQKSGSTKLPRGWILLCGLGSLVFWAPWFATSDLTGFGDWQWFHRQWELGRIAYLKFGELPLWDSSQCGGSSLWAQPQSQVFSPLYLLLALPLGTVTGSKLWAVVHSFAAAVGMVLLAHREYRLHPAGTLIATVVFAFSGFFAWHGTGGHATYFAFYYLPWLVLGHRRSMYDRRYCALVAGVLGMALLEGAHYPVPYFVLVLASEGVRALIVHRSKLATVFKAELVSGVLTLMLGAFRLVPIAAAVVDNPKEVPSLDSLNLSEALLMFTARSHQWHLPGHVWVWAEYGTYIGWAALALGGAGLIHSLGRRRDLVAGFLIAFAIMLGDLGPYSPWSLMHNLPFYERLHLPSRFAVFVSFYLALAAGAALDALSHLSLRQHQTHRAMRYALWTIALGITVDIFSVNVKTNNRWNHPPLHEDMPDGRYHLIPGEHFHRVFASYPRRNVGVTECYDATNWSVAEDLWVGDTAQAKVIRGGGKVHDWNRSNTRAFAEVTLKAPGVVAFNQNYARGWTSNIGAAFDYKGLMSVRDVPAGTQRIELEFKPPEFYPLLMLLLLGSALCLRIAATPHPW
ncbi:MAG: hypothetical protein AAF355_11770 [Myxococcota bacterium]